MARARRTTGSEAAHYCRECLHGKPYTSVHNVSVKGEPLCVWCGVTGTAQPLSLPACKDFKAV